MLVLHQEEYNPASRAINQYFPPAFPQKCAAYTGSDVQHVPVKVCSIFRFNCAPCSGQEDEIRKAVKLRTLTAEEEIEIRHITASLVIDITYEWIFSL
jgi:hypothetical protein